MSEFEIPSASSTRTKSFKQKLNEIPAPSSTSSINLVPPDEPKESQEKNSVNEKPLWPKEELLRVFDEIVFSGEYMEQFLIKNRVPVTFKTRTGEDAKAIQRIIDSSGLNLVASVEMLRSITTLQYSLVSYDKKDLTLVKPEERLRYIESLPAPIIGMLLDLLNKFDSKVGAACREGEENF